MAVKYKRNCNSCQLSKADARVRKRIRHAAFKREDGDETLADIAVEVGIPTSAMYNHARKHISDVASNFAATTEIKVAKKKEEFKGKVQKEMELALEGTVLDSIEARPAEIVALDDYIAQAKALIDKGQLKITATNFLAATKIRTDYRNKQDNTKLDYMKTIYALASGGKHGQYSTGATTAVDNRGTEQPRSLYQSAAGSETS